MLRSIGTDHKNSWIPKILKILKKCNIPRRVGRWKYEKKTRTWPKNDNFCIFSVFLFIFFRGPTWDGEFVFFRISRSFGIQGFCGLHQARRITSSVFIPAALSAKRAQAY